MTADRKIFSAVFVDRNAEVVLLHQISKSRKKINEQFTTINVKEKETLTSNPTKNENKWSVVSGKWIVLSLAPTKHLSFHSLSLPLSLPLTPLQNQQLKTNN